MGMKASDLRLSISFAGIGVATGPRDAEVMLLNTNCSPTGT